jgi:glycosyltransferase involved in cell wall biosynthesis
VSVDILLPYYGDVALMQAAVESVRSQTVTDWRLKVVDDGTPAEGIAEWFASLQDDRISYERNEQNLGANLNYRKALGLATAELIVIMGADDVMLPNYLEVVTRAMAEFPEAAIVQPGVEVIDEHGQVYLPLVDRVKKLIKLDGSGRRVYGGEELARSLLRGNWTLFPSLCWRTEAVRRHGFRPDLHVVQDLALILDIVKDGGTMVVTDELCFQYRRHSASDSSVKALRGPRFDEERAYFETMAAEMSALGWKRAARAARLHLLSRLHAATYLPLAVQKKDRQAIRALAKHAL